MEFRRWGAATLVITGLAGCATSSLPARPRAATTLRDEDISEPVGRTLRTEPPLPDDAIDGWDGLGSDEDAQRARSATALDVEGAVRLALVRNRELRARIAALDVVRGRVTQRGALPNPELELEVLPERETGLEISVAYDVTAAILAPLRARATRPELDAERHAVAAEALALAYEVRAACFALASAMERLRVGQRALDAFAASRDAAEALYAAGNATALERVSERAAFERARVLVAALELEVVAAREHLRRLLGLDGSESVDFAIDLDAVPSELPDLAAMERRALEASHALEGARARVEALARQAGLVRTEGRLPDVSVDVHVLRGRPNDDAPGRDPARAVGGGVSIAVPLFDARRGDRRAADAALAAAEERYEGLALDIRSRARVQRARLEVAHARARHLDVVVAAAQAEVLDQTRRQYDAMQVDVFRLLEARRAVLELELARVDARRIYAVERAATDALLAGAVVGDGAPVTNTTLPAAESGEGAH